MQEKIFELLFDKDEITWQTMIYKLVKNEEMDPWDVDISLLTKRFLQMLKKFKKMDFRISGKVVLAAALLLRIKSNKLVGEDLVKLEQFMSGEEDQEEFSEETESENSEFEEEPRLMPRTPQPRKRKVSVYDLVNALQKALVVKKRRVLHSIPTMEIDVPEKKKDISLVIRDIYYKIKSLFKTGKERLTFSMLVPSEKKEDKVFTFIPLLHLSNQNKVELEQKEHFGEIEIYISSKRQVDKELQ